MIDEELIDCPLVRPEVWTSINHIPPQDEFNYSCAKIEDNTTIKCRYDILNNVISNEELKKDFKITVKKLNRWYYKVHFSKLDK